MLDSYLTLVRHQITIAMHSQPGDGLSCTPVTQESVEQEPLQSPSQIT
jgi:hypothetical protein